MPAAGGWGHVRDVERRSGPGRELASTAHRPASRHQDHDHGGDRLAQETARATEQITRQVSSIQAESNSTVDAIQQIADVIATINAYTGTIAAAVEEQTATTSEIARSVQHAAEGSSSIAETAPGSPWQRSR